MHDAADLAAYREQALAWLSERLERRPQAGAAWGEGPDDVSVFRALDDDDERALLDRLAAWQRTKVDAGYGAISWPRDVGGAGLTAAHERAFLAAEQEFVTPGEHETLSVTVHLVAPTVDAFGTPDQRARLVPPLLRADELCCQLFSEPGAGSDLASVSFRATRDGDTWILNGQKVWSSGARFAAWGELIARTDPAAARHAGLTAFIVPMDLPGIDVRPIRQMSGGTSFNEVFFDDVRVDDGCRLGSEGDGWKVALATLGFERASTGASDAGIGGTPEQVIALAHWLGLEEAPLHRQRLAALWSDEWVRRAHRRRTEAADVGPAGSVGKLLWTERLTETSVVVSSLLGPRLAADSGEWGTFAWSEHVLGAPGYRIAGGSDEIQRNIIAERVLGLPRDPRP